MLTGSQQAPGKGYLELEPMQLLASSVEQLYRCSVARVCGMTAGWQAGQV